MPYYIEGIADNQLLGIVYQFVKRFAGKFNE